MYGDPDAIRRQGTALREQAEELRREADRLLAAATAVAWRSTSAERMRSRVEDRHREIRGTADEVDAAAAALDAHAAEVERLIALIATIEHKVRGMISAALDRIRSAGNALIEGVKDLAHGRNPLDDLLAGFNPPPSGHKAWLDVPDQIPGVGE